MGNKPAEQRCETFADLIAEGVKLLAELRRLEARKKLSGQAFVDAACRHAGIEPGKLPQIESAVAKAGIAELDSFVRKIAALYADPNCPIPFPPGKFGRALGAFGARDDGIVLAAMNAAKIGLGEALALAAHRAAEEHADRFGTIEDWVEHTDALNLARDQIAGLCRQLARSWTMEDIVLSVDGLSDGERARGLVKLTFKAAPELHVGQPNWPLRLVEIAAAERGSRKVKAKAAQDGPEPKPKGGIARRRLSENAIHA